MALELAPCLPRLTTTDTLTLDPAWALPALLPFLRQILHIRNGSDAWDADFLCDELLLLLCLPAVIASGSHRLAIFHKSHLLYLIHTIVSSGIIYPQLPHSGARTSSTVPIGLLGWFCPGGPPLLWFDELFELVDVFLEEPHRGRFW